MEIGHGTTDYCGFASELIRPSSVGYVLKEFRLKKETSGMFTFPYVNYEILYILTEVGSLA